MVELVVSQFVVTSSTVLYMGYLLRTFVQAAEIEEGFESKRTAGRAIDGVGRGGSSVLVSTGASGSGVQSAGGGIAVPQADVYPVGNVCVETGGVCSAEGVGGTSSGGYSSCLRRRGFRGGYGPTDAYSVVTVLVLVEVMVPSRIVVVKVSTSVSYSYAKFIIQQELFPSVPVDAAYSVEMLVVVVDSGP